VAQRVDANVDSKLEDYNCGLDPNGQLRALCSHRAQRIGATTRLAVAPPRSVFWRQPWRHSGQLDAICGGFRL
jgi:hypothetical protein